MPPTDKQDLHVPLPPPGNSSADLMFRLMSGNTFLLSQMADSKANIMITISAGIIGLSANRLLDPQFTYSALALIITCLSTLVFAVFTIMPRLRKQKDADAADPGFNIMFFGDFSRLTYQKFQQELDGIVGEPRKAYSVIARDAYLNGRLLAEKKYRYLSYTYRTFLTGFIISAVILFVSMLMRTAA
jgi:hypothetical protein